MLVPVVRVLGGIRINLHKSVPASKLINVSVSFRFYCVAPSFPLASKVTQAGYLCHSPMHNAVRMQRWTFCYST